VGLGSGGLGTNLSSYLRDIEQLRRHQLSLFSCLCLRLVFSLRWLRLTASFDLLAIYSFAESLLSSASSSLSSSPSSSSASSVSDLADVEAGAGAAGVCAS